MNTTHTVRIIKIALGVAVLALGLVTINKALTNPETVGERQLQSELCRGVDSDLCADSF